MSLEPASDIIRCELEYDSIDQIESARSRAAATTSFMNEMMLKMLGLDTRETDSADEAQAREEQRQVFKSMMAGVDTQDTTKRYTIDPTRRALLEQIYAQSRLRLTSWLPPCFRPLAADLTFEQWLRNWVRAPLSGHDEFADKATKGYFALSYVWADSPFPLHDPDLLRALKLAEAGGLSSRDLTKAPVLRKKQILLNDRHVEVGVNLEQALRALREIPEIQAGTRLWVDSLCIDQSNIPERNREVKRMGEIYSKADRVVCYIGPAQDHSDDVLEVMESLGQAIRTEQAANLMAHWFRLDLNSEFFYYLTRLMSRPYWSRIWIMQEVALASEKSLIICGTKRFSAMNVLLFGKRNTQSTLELEVPMRGRRIGQNRFLNDGDDETSKLPMTVGTFVDGIAKLKNTYELRLLLERNKVELEIFNTLWFRTAAENRATDPRDLVYGMLALLLSPLVEKIKVDYSAANTYQQVMIDFAVAHIGTYNSLHWILLRPWFSFYHCEDWPSWVPNLGLPFSSAHFWWAIGPFKAWDGLDAAKPPARNEGSLLHCQGFRVDVVRQATAPVSPDITVNKDLWDALPKILDALSKEPGTTDMSVVKEALYPLPNSTPTEVTMVNVGLSVSCSQTHRYKDQAGLKAALSACLGHLQLVPQDNKDDIFSIPYNIIIDAALRQAYRSLLNPSHAPMTASDWALMGLANLVKHAGHLELWGSELRHLFALDQAHDTRDVYIPALAPADRTAQLGRLFTTASGYVGVALSDLCAGDEIYVLAGCAMPVALRPSTKQIGTFELLGGVFLAGAMEGEAVTEHLARSGVVGDVTLC